MDGIKLGGTSFRVRYSFLVFNALIFLLRDSRVILAFYGVCLIHELGHCIAIRFFGGKVSSVEFSGLGIRITAPPPRSLREGIAVLMSGPAVNIAAFLLLESLGRNGYAAELNLAEGLFNLLPFPFLDGGALLLLIAEGSPSEALWRKIMTVLQAVTVCVLVYLLFSLKQLI